MRFFNPFRLLHRLDAPTENREETKPIVKPVHNIQHKEMTQGFFDKRQKFIIGIIILSLIFLSIQFNIGQQDIFIVVALAILTNVFLYWAMRHDLKDNMMYTIFILPFFYSLAFGLFYLLIPTRIIFRLILTFIYGLGLYSLFLSQNIFVVGAIRTIQLLTGARIVSFMIAILCFVFLVNTVISLHFALPIILGLLLLCIYPLTYHSLWIYVLQKAPFRLSLWSGGVTLCLLEIATVLLFWPSSPTVLALYLGSIFYLFVGLSHVWIERRLFRNVMWEFSWILIVAFLFLFLFTSWGN